MSTTYRVTCHYPPDLDNPPPQAQVVVEGWHPHPFDAAKQYIRTHMPGWRFLPGGRNERPGLYRFEAIRNDRAYDCVIWVREV